MSRLCRREPPRAPAVAAPSRDTPNRSCRPACARRPRIIAAQARLQREMPPLSVASEAAPFLGQRRPDSGSRPTRAVMPVGGGCRSAAGGKRELGADAVLAGRGREGWLEGGGLAGHTCHASCHGSERTPWPRPRPQGAGRGSDWAGCGCWPLGGAGWL